MMRITAAQMLRHYDERTDVRDPGEVADDDELAALNVLLADGAIDLTSGLVGWDGYTHTARARQVGQYVTYHVAVTDV